MMLAMKFLKAEGASAVGYRPARRSHSSEADEETRAPRPHRITGVLAQLVITATDSSGRKPGPFREGWKHMSPSL